MEEHPKQNNVHSFSKFWAIKRIPFYINRKQSNRNLDGDNKFKTTEKGLNFLKMHNQIEEFTF
jgi:hypothetical protein